MDGVQPYTVGPLPTAAAVPRAQNRLGAIRYRALVGEGPGIPSSRFWRPGSLKCSAIVAPLPREQSPASPPPLSLDRSLKAMSSVDRARSDATPSTPPLCLTSEEVADLTGKSRPSAQRRALNHMAIDHKQRPDGTILVLRSALDAPPEIRHSGRRTEPNWR
jgi:hypothetical protein